MANQHINVWTDGSARNDAMGAAWLIRVNGSEDITGSRVIRPVVRPLRGHESDCAELLAIKFAGAAIPEGASVNWRLDAQNILDWMKDRQVSSKIKRGIPEFMAIFHDAIMATQGKKIEWIKVGGAKNAELKRVNDEARAATTPVKKLER